MADLPPSRLPILWRPLPDELMSSWLIRVARANALRAQEMAFLISGRQKQVLWNDLDVINVDSDLAALERLLCCSREQLDQVLLVNDLRRLSLMEMKPTGSYRWLLPRSNRVGRPSRRWLQFCPQCLAEDAVPYFRRHWRLAFISSCTKHCRLLRDECASCQAVFSFHLIDRGRSALQEDLPLSICPVCGHDARIESELLAQQPSKRLLDFQRRLELAWRTGWIERPGNAAPEVDLYAGQFFDVLHRLVAQINASPRIRNWFLDDSSRRFGNEVTDLLRPDQAFVFWPATLRMVTMEWLAFVFGSWPTRFVAEARRVNANYSDVCGERELLPYWYSRIMDDALKRFWYAPSSVERDAATRYLQTCGANSSFYAVRRMLGRWFPKRTAGMVPAAPRQSGRDNTR